MDERLVVERLGPYSRNEAVEVLCEAFRDYPVFRYALKDAGESYSRDLDALIGHFTDARLMQGYPVLTHTRRSSPAPTALTTRRTGSG